MVRNDIKKSSLLRTKVLIYAFNGRTLKSRFLGVKSGLLGLKNYVPATKLERQNGTKRRFWP